MTLDHHPDYGTSLDGDVYCRQCRKNDYTDEDDRLCDKCREANEPKLKWSDVKIGDKLRVVTTGAGRVESTKDSKGVIAIHPKTEKTSYAIEMDGGFHFFPEQDKLVEIIRPKPEPDFRVDNHGSIFILTGLTDACREWIEANVGDDQTQTWGRHGIVVEHRYIADIVHGLQNEGFIGS